jgi:hypothetical protein
VHLHHRYLEQRATGLANIVPEAAVLFWTMHDKIKPELPSIELFMVGQLSRLRLVGKALR